ncbi:MAG: DNA repair protein RecO [Bacteroidia bacterium]
MLHKTRGLVFRTIRYTDSSVIVHIFTEAFGLRSYLVPGARSKKAKIKASLFQPLALVEINVSNREKNTLHRISDMTAVQSWNNIAADIRKSSTLLFLNEVLYKTIREEAPHSDLFEFISQALEMLDLSTENNPNFHLVFLCRLATMLGFAPQGEYSSETPFFNLAEGQFQDHEPSHVHFLEGDISKQFGKILNLNFENSHQLQMTGSERRVLVRSMIDYFRLHISSIKEIKSMAVLEEVLG